MRATWIVAAHYFKRLSHKPLLIVLMLAIPFTLLLAEYEAFGRPRSLKAVVPIPVKVIVRDHSQVVDRFVECLSQQPGHPLTPGESGSVIMVSSSSPIKVVAKFMNPDATDSVLESSLVKVCASQSSQSVSLASIAVVKQLTHSSVSGANSFLVHFFPGLALFGALFLSQSMASLVWRDHERTIQKRLLTAPVSPVALVFGPLVFLSAGAAIALCLILGLCGFFTNAAALASPVFWTIAIGFGLCAAGLQLAIGLLAGGLRAANAMSSSANMMLAFFGGGFVPLYLYPPLLRSFAYVLPNGAAQAGLIQTLAGSGSSHDLLRHVIAVWAWATLLIGVSIILQFRRMRS